MSETKLHGMDYSVSIGLLKIAAKINNHSTQRLRSTHVKLLAAERNYALKRNNLHCHDQNDSDFSATCSIHYLVMM